MLLVLPIAWICDEWSVPGFGIRGVANERVVERGNIERILSERFEVYLR